MATATISTPKLATKVPVEVYLKTHYEPDADYVDGEVWERPMGGNEHSAWQHAIGFWFGTHAEEWNIRIRPELRMQVTPNNYLVADVAILYADAPQTGPPWAVFEIWSPDRSHRRLIKKLNLYKDMGVPHIWHIDPADGVWQKFVDKQLVDADVFVDPELEILFRMEEISKLVR